MSPERTRRRARAVAALVLLLVVGTLNRQGPSPPPPLAGEATIHFRHVDLDASAPGRRRLGALVYLDGWTLDSTNGEFGGISAMQVDAGIVTALTDSGFIIRFPVPKGASGEVRGRIDPLAEGAGGPVKKEARDTEALAIAGGSAWVGYERRNIVARFRTQDWRRDAYAEPPQMRRWPNNGGSEGLVRLRDGRFLIFSEAARGADETSDLLLFDRDPMLAQSHIVRLGYRAPRGYVATDAAELPDGRLLILNRRLSLAEGTSVTLVIAPMPNRGSVMAGRLIAALQPPVTVDNMEALSVTREGRRTIVWIASDDNFSPPLQRTLLMKFALAE